MSCLKPDFIIVDEPVKPMTREKREEWMKTFEARLARIGQSVVRIGNHDHSLASLATHVLGGEQIGQEALAHEDAMKRTIGIMPHEMTLFPGARYEDMGLDRIKYGWKKKKLADDVIHTNRTNRSPGASAPMKRGRR